MHVPYIHTHHGKDQLITYEYDDRGNLILLLPPAYHENPQENFRQTVGWNLLYDTRNKIIEKTAPDTGKTGFIYDKEGQIRFKINYSQDGKLQYIVDYLYNEEDEMIQISYSNEDLSRDQLQLLADQYEALPSSILYQSYFRETVWNPSIKSLGRVIYVQTHNEKKEATLSERLFYTTEKKLLSKSIQLGETFYQLSYQCDHQKPTALYYPATSKEESLKIIFGYNYQGQLISLGTEEYPQKYAIFEYNAQGLLTSETVLPTSEFKIQRDYTYNSPGFLTRIEDNFFVEILDYFENGYGDAIYGDGSITCTKFQKKWDSLKVNFPENYRYQYEYGAYGELIKAKYSEGNQGPLKPLRPSTFSEEISGIDAKQSTAILELLIKADYLILDASNPKHPTAKQVGYDKLLSTSLGEKSFKMRGILSKLLLDSLFQNQPLS